MDRAPGRRRREVATVLVAAAVFVAVSLWPWRQLVGPAYLLRFVLFASGLGALCLALTALAGRWSGRRGAPLAALVSALVLVPVWRWNDTGRPDVVLVVLDSFRADHSSAYGYERETTAHLDAFARDHAVLFRHFLAQSAGTDKSTPAILAGVLPSMFYDPESDGTDYSLPEWYPLLSERLRRAGYATWGLSSNPNVALRTGYGRGFDAFEETWREGPRAHELVARLQARLQERPADGRDAPLFAFAFVLDPHSPYEPLPAFDRWSSGSPVTHDDAREAFERAGAVPPRLVAELVARYDGEILEVDDALGGLLDWLEAEGRLERTMLLVTSDHGEKFGRHGEFGHGGALWGGVLRVPAVWHLPSPLRVPALRPAVREHERLACHVDVLPTVLGFLGLDGAEGLPGHDLVPVLYGLDDPPPRQVLCEELAPGQVFRALRTRDKKAMALQLGDGPVTRLLVDLAADPAESVVYGPDDDPTGALQRLHAELERRAADARRAYRPKPDAERPDPTSERVLLELGYVR